jgi:magnesium transporter
MMADELQSSQQSTADGTSGVAKVKTVACLGGVSLERGVPDEEIHDYIREADNTVWIDVQNPGQEELSMLLEQFGFHPLALENVAMGEQRPKVDEYKGHLFVVTYAVASKDDSQHEVRTAEVDLFIGRNYVVTLHRGRVPALEEAYNRWTRGGAMLREGVGFLVYTVMDAIIDGFFPVIDRIEDEIDEIEIEMFTQLNPRAVQSLLRLKRTLVTLRRVLYPLREMFHVFLRRDHAMFSANTQVYFQDVNGHVLRCLDILDIEREMVSGALDAYQMVLSNRLNVTMKTLAIISMVVGIAGLTFGAWGMNFEYIPWHGHPWGFWGVMIGTAGLIGGVLLFGWKKGWL